MSRISSTRASYQPTLRAINPRMPVATPKQLARLETIIMEASRLQTATTKAAYTMRLQRLVQETLALVK